VQIDALLPDKRGDVVGKADPIEFKFDRTRAAVGWSQLIVQPALRRLVVARQVIVVHSQTALPAIRRQVQVVLAQVGLEFQSLQARFFSRLAQRAGLRDFAVLDLAAGNLDAGLGILRVAKDEQAVAVGDVGDGAAGE
jgi:hypothetical protein